MTDLNIQIPQARELTLILVMIKFSLDKNCARIKKFEIEVARTVGKLGGIGFNGTDMRH